MKRAMKGNFSQEKIRQVPEEKFHVATEINL